MIRTSRILLVGLILAAIAYSQPATPPPGDPEVFLSYLRRAHQEVQGITQRRDTSEASAARLGAQASDLPAIEAVFQSTIVRLAALDAETKHYVDDAIQKGQKPARSHLEQLYARRIEILQQARNLLRQGLAPANWSKVEAYIEGEHRNTIKRSGLPWPSVQ